MDLDPLQCKKTKFICILLGVVPKGSQYLVDLANQIIAHPNTCHEGITQLEIQKKLFKTSQKKMVKGEI